MRLGREAALGLFLLVTVVTGAAFDLTSNDLSARRSLIPPPIFDERSVYCPPPPLPVRSSSQVVIGSPADEDFPVGINGDERVPLASGRTLTRENNVATDLVGYGAEVVASALTTFTGKPAGIGAARCSKVASERWYFAEGSSALGAEQRFVVYNPFPDEAVVGISLITPDGPQGNANLSSGLPVPAGETLVVELNEFIRQSRFVGAALVANRGRVIAWRALQVNTERRPEGAQFTLGATGTATQWFFPEGALQDDVDERISLLNPTEEEAVATISLATVEETIQPPRLLEVVVPPRTLLPVPLHDYVGGSDRRVGGASVVVRTTSGALVAERSVYYDTDSLTGVASEVGAARAAPRWFLGPAVDAPETDSVTLLNPGAKDVKVSLTLLSGLADPQRPGPLQDVTVRAGGRAKVLLGEWTRDQSISVLVEAKRDIVAERFSSKDSEVASVMGSPLLKPSGR